MKKILLSIISLILITSCAPSAKIESADALAVQSSSAMPSEIGECAEEMRGAWIASVYNINFPSAPDLSEEKLKGELDLIVSEAKDLGLNAIFFQARPSSDALYRSELFPVSRFLSSSGELYFDPLDYIIEKCHENSIELHVWINPLRVTTSVADSREKAIGMLDPGIGAGRSPENLVYYGDRKLYLNAGIPEARASVVECVEEIVANYPVDGVIFDDYFYPYPTEGAEFDDSEAFKKYGGGMSLEDWRRENINSLVREVYEKIKETDPDCLFGIAPFGIWKNGDGGESGSRTSGMEAYHTLYCDALAWARGGYVDYLSPQLYWETDSAAASYSELCRWWSLRLDGTGCDFIPSLAAYRYDGDWQDPDGEIDTQVSLGREMINYRGVIYYGFAALSKNAEGIADEVETLSGSSYVYYDSLTPSDALVILSPKNGYVSSDDSVTLSGLSDPKYRVTVNGEVIGRCPGGAFEEVVALDDGENIIEIICGEEKETVSVFFNGDG